MTARNHANSGFWRACLPVFLVIPATARADGSVDTRALLADGNSFQARLIPRLAELDRQNITYRLPVPGARVTGGILQANAPLAGLKIQYRAGRTRWRTYHGPVAESGPVALRTLSPDGRRVSRMVGIN